MAKNTNAQVVITAQTAFVALPVGQRNNGTQAVNNWPLAAAGFNVLLNALQAKGVNPFGVYRQAKANTLWLNGYAPKAEVMVSVVKGGGFSVKVKTLHKGGQTVHLQQQYATLEAVANCPHVMAHLVAPMPPAPVNTTPAAAAPAAAAVV